MLREMIIGLLVLLMSSTVALAQIPMVQHTSDPAPPNVPMAGPLQQNGLMSFIHNLFLKIMHKHPDDPDPSGTLLAPFADVDAKPVMPGEHSLMRLPTNGGALDQPHRSSADLGEWLTQALSETLSFNAENYNDHIKMLSKGMDAGGLGQFNAWTTSSGILAALQNNGLQLNGFVQEKPFLLNEGAVSGRYRWLFEIPVVISFVPRGTTSLDKQSGIDSRKLIVTLQIGRVVDSELPDHVRIESWSVQDNTRKN